MRWFRFIANMALLYVYFIVYLNVCMCVRSAFIMEKYSSQTGRTQRVIILQAPEFGL